MTFVAAVAALVDAVADVGGGEAAAEEAAVATGAVGLAPAPCCCCTVLPVGGVDYPVDPVDVAGHFGVDARTVGPRAAVAVARHAVQRPTSVRFLNVIQFNSIIHY